MKITTVKNTREFMYAVNHFTEGETIEMLPG